MTFYKNFKFLTVFAVIASCVHSLNAAAVATETTQKKVDAAFVEKPIANKPLLLVVLHGLGRTSEKTQTWAEKKFAKKTKLGAVVNVKALNYEKVDLAPFQQKIHDTLQRIEATQDPQEKMKIVHEEEQKLLPELRQLITQNLDKVLAEFGDTPLQNVIVVGYSLGGLVGSVLVEVLGNSTKGQVQALLTSMAPPVGFVNCAFGITEKEDEISLKTLFPWIMHCEMGEKDPIFIKGVLKMHHCFSIFSQLTDVSKKHFTNDTHEGDHKTSRIFSKKIFKALEVAALRQQDKKAPISVH